MSNRLKNKKYVFVLFGATGDLALKKIFPALASISGPKIAHVIAVSRREWGDKDFTHHLASVSKNTFWPDFLNSISYSRVDIEKGEGFESLASKIVILKKKFDAEVVAYLSLAPRHHGPVFSALVESGIVSKGDGKILIEKPFGVDEKTARSLDKLILSKVGEEQVFRVDHYLGKDTVDAIMALHEGTSDFDKLISAESVDHIRVRLFESKGIEGRGSSYDEVGAFRDVGQNHMLEMLAVVAAELGKERDKGRAWQVARAKVFKHLAPPANTCDESRRGQYEGYATERGVKPGSSTETAFEIRTALASGKLKGTALILESGKKMPTSEAFIEVVFKELSGIPKRMRFSIQPKQEIVIENRDGSVEEFDIPVQGDAYANVIAAALDDRMREFVGSEEIEALWAYADRVVGCWDKVPLEIYSEKKPFLIP